MRRRSRLVWGAAVSLFIGGLVPVLGPASSQAAAAPVVIGVDHTPPSGHDFLYVDFFPRSSVTVHQGDVVDFHWNRSPDGFHTADLLKSGETPQQHLAANPTATPDTDDEAGKLQLNPALGAPTFPPPGSGAPTACGDATTPCAYDGSQDVNSGAKVTDGLSSFFVKINVPAGRTLTFLCNIHPGMQGSLRTVASSAAVTTPAQAASAATTQANSDTNGALAAETAASNASTTVSATGKRTIHVVAGTATPYVEVVEFLPKSITIGAGDTVQWATKTIKDIHTVTFPGTTKLADPIPSVCEASGSTDTPFTGGAGPPCGNPANFETHLIPAPVGLTAISTASQLASSGLLANPPAPFRSSYSFTFPTTGAFTFVCRVHENGMHGTIVVNAASAPATAVTGTPRLTG